MGPGLNAELFQRCKVWLALQFFDVASFFQWLHHHDADAQFFCQWQYAFLNGALNDIVGNLHRVYSTTAHYVHDLRIRLIHHGGNPNHPNLSFLFQSFQGR